MLHPALWRCKYEKTVKLQSARCGCRRYDGASNTTNIRAVPDSQALEKRFSGDDANCRGADSLSGVPQLVGTEER